jgi:hypothetical protein
MSPKKSTKEVLSYSAVANHLSFMLLVVLSFYFAFTRLTGEIKKSDRYLLIFSSAFALVTYSFSNQQNHEEKK